MNRGDVFLLDMGLTIYVWNGSQAGRLERVKGMDIARRIRDEERGGKAEIEVMGESNEFSSRMNICYDGKLAIYCRHPSYQIRAGHYCDACSTACIYICVERAVIEFAVDQMQVHRAASQTQSGIQALDGQSPEN